MIIKIYEKGPHYSGLAWFKPIGLNHWFKPWFKPTEKTKQFMVFSVYLVFSVFYCFFSI